MKIVTLNAFGAPQSFTRKVRFSLLAKELVREQQDLILLQEVIFGRDWRILETDLKPLGYHFWPTKRKWFNRSGLLIISKFPILEPQFTRFEDQGRWFSSEITDRILGKGFVIFQIKIDQERVWIINSHLINHYAVYDTIDNNIFIQYQVAQLIRSIKTLIPTNDPFILAGDLDFPFDCNFPKEISESLGVRESLVNKNVITYDKANLNLKGWLRSSYGHHTRVDFIFHRNLPWKSVSTELTFQKPVEYEGKKYHVSDHYGLEMTGE